MHLRLLLIGLFSICSNINYAQFSTPYGSDTFIVQWVDTTNLDEKTQFEIDFQSMIICEMTFVLTPDTITYAWLHIRNSFPLNPIGGVTPANIEELVDLINVTGGVIGSQAPPVVDGSTFDFYSNQTNSPGSGLQDCDSNFDLTIPFGPHEVSLFNLDTGAQSDIYMVDCPDLDFSGDVNCLGNVINSSQSCEDFNGHGTHGFGIQQSILNKSIDDFGGTKTVNLFSYKVFDDHGIGSLGAILCALSEIIENPAPRKVVNCSFSVQGVANVTTINDPLKVAFEAMAAENIFSVVAAGNDENKLEFGEFMLFPLGYFSDPSTSSLQEQSSTIAIGAANCDHTPAGYGNYSPTYVDVSTLGTVPGPGLNGQCEFYEGTSQATFISSTIAAILFTHRNDIDLERLKCSMITSTDIFLEFENHNYGAGILQASVALQKFESGCEIDDNCPPILRVNGNTSGFDYESSGIIISDAQVLNNDVTFKAEKSIILEPGFLAEPIVQFLAIIDDCRSSQ